MAQYKQPARLGVVEPSNSQAATSITPTSPRQEAQQKIEQELNQLGIKVNSTLSRSIRSTDEQTVLAALAALREAVEVGQVKNPAGWLRRAIEDQWQPNDSHTQKNDLKLFNEWFALARAQRLVIASTQSDQEMMVLTANEEWLPFSEILNTYPLKTLK